MGSASTTASTMIASEVRSSRRRESARRNRLQRRRKAPPRRCLALCCIGVLLLSSSKNKKERSRGTIVVGGVGASDRQPAPPTTASASRTFRFALPTLRRGFPEDDDDHDHDHDHDRRDGGSSSPFFVGGVGREFDLFDTRGGVAVDDATGGGDGAGEYASSPLSPVSSYAGPNVSSPGQPPSSSSSSSSSSYPSYVPSSSNRAGGRAYSSSSNRRRRPGSRPSASTWYGSSTSNPAGGGGGPSFHRAVVEPVQNWWSTHVTPNVKSWPKLTCRVEPTTSLKIRKTFRPIGTIVRLGADFNTQLGVWQFKSSWEDAFLGGKLTLAGRELQLTKSWQLSVTAVEDLVTRLRCRAAVDLQTWKAYVRVGFRTERLSPINVVEGFTILKQIPLDGNKGHVKLEVKAILSLPEPEIEYSTETQRSLVGMGDIEVNVEELNLLLDY